MYQTVLKRYELISPYPFFVAVKVFLITCLVLLALVFSVLSPIQSQGFLVLRVWVGPFPPQPPPRFSSLCAWHIPDQSLPSVGSRSWSYSDLWVFLLTHREATLASLLPPLHFSPPLLSDRTCKALLRRVANVLCSSLSSWSLQALSERQGDFNACLASGKLGHKRQTGTGSNERREGEPRAESYLKHHSHRNILLPYCISFNPNAIIFTVVFNLFLVGNSCN